MGGGVGGDYHVSFISVPGVPGRLLIFLLTFRRSLCARPRGARPGPRPGEAGPGEAGRGWPVRMWRGRGPVRARRRAEAPCAGEAGPRPARTRAGVARRTVTASPRIAHAECAAIAPCSCGIRRPGPGKARNSRREMAGILLVPEAENG